jgi:predicted DNA-binding protein YlxM (UPF0122 family)
VIGDPQQLYHNRCDEVICIGYESRPHIYKDVQLVNGYVEFPHTDGSLETKASDYGTSVSIDGYEKIDVPERNLIPSDVSALFKKQVDKIVSKNPEDLFTRKQRKALQLYYGLTGGRGHSFQVVAEYMQISKNRAATYVYRSQAKLRSYIITEIMGEMMNGLSHDLDKSGIVVTYVTRSLKDLNINDFDRIKSFMLTAKCDELLSREQFEALWLFCGIDGKRYSVKEIAALLDISENGVRKRIKTAIVKIDTYIVDVVFNTVDDRKCAARDCMSVFTPVNDAHIYCSPQCKNRERVRRHREKIKKSITYRKCAYCGNTFIPRSDRHVYCSSNCGNLHKDPEYNEKFKLDISCKRRPRIHPVIQITQAGGRVIYQEEERARDIADIAG